MMRFAISILTMFLKLLYSLTHCLAGTRKQVVCLSRQTDGTTTDFELLKERSAGFVPLGTLESVEGLCCVWNSFFLLHAALLPLLRCGNEEGEDGADERADP